MISVYSTRFRRDCVCVCVYTVLHIFVILRHGGMQTAVTKSTVKRDVDEVYWKSSHNRITVIRFVYVTRRSVITIYPRGILDERERRRGETEMVEAKDGEKCAVETPWFLWESISLTPGTVNASAYTGKSKDLPESSGVWEDKNTIWIFTSCIHIVWIHW